LKILLQESERFADGQIGRKEFFAISRAARAPYKELYNRCFGPEREINPQEMWVFHAFSSVDCTTAPKCAPITLRVVTSQIWETVRWWMEAQKKTKQEVFAITSTVKEKFANNTLEFFEYLSAPFAVPTTWPLTVVCLARALYEGEECGYALHDALEEHGQNRLADHFQMGSHPKGCWALDLILGKS
jgi:hypothetical protein